MVAYAPIPSNEAARLAALHSYCILDTPPDERFDLFTRLAIWLFNAPIAAINIVDADRTFFKSLTGMPAYEPERCTSICAHAIGIGDPILVVNDLACDSRFVDHPLFIKRGIRFYAGALLRSTSGDALGTLCIADTIPRLFSDDDRQKLTELANGVGAVLELHRHGIWLLQAASQDALTGLYNRRAFEEALQRTVAQANADRMCALLYFDLDGFKSINDRFGHAGGDAILCEVGRRLLLTTGANNVAARLGGDEFVVLLSEPSCVIEVNLFAKNVLAAFAAPFEVQGEYVPIRSSIGIALCPPHAIDAANLLRCADAALYEAKQNGRSLIRMYQGAVPTSATGAGMTMSMQNGLA